ncbi:DUF1499 domain-containing protein [Synechococcus sp. NOUM97013]|uniref:DUF1499 domain-containing protein n=1 Tax=Synechococcus sp. NOUM97013 TaxID=1442555 RepID=UPI0016495221|nr:DUF1499 domain-containing protein [Synechococcus sp. NOUM97013]QNI73926.1 hypothetical protein SynNOUM97013_01868 [Synechococcus sp. NOUM97013]
MTFFSAITLPLLLALFHFVGPVPSDLGIQAGHLSPCPGPAHCASATWPVANAEAALTSLAEAIDADPSATVVEREANYLHATFSSRIFGFIDDVELLASQPDSLEARSISRLGDSDLGVNGQRLQHLSEALPAH